MSKHTKHINHQGLSQQKSVRQGSRESLASKEPLVPVDQRHSPITQIENSYEFYTRQRPLSFTPFYRKMVRPLYDTKNTTSVSFVNNGKASEDFFNVLEGECVIVNHFEANILYLPYRDFSSASVTVQQNVAATRIGDNGADAITNEATNLNGTPFSFGLNSSSNSLYDSEVISFFSGFNPAGDKGVGFSTLNQNVLDFGNDGGTTLYIPENSIVKYVYEFFVNPNRVIPQPALNNYVLISFEVRGHKTTMRDYEIIRRFNQKTDVLDLV